MASPRRTGPRTRPFPPAPLSTPSCSSAHPTLLLLPSSSTPSTSSFPPPPPPPPAFFPLRIAPSLSLYACSSSLTSRSSSYSGSTDPLLFPSPQSPSSSLPHPLPQSHSASPLLPNRPIVPSPAHLLSSSPSPPSLSLPPPLCLRPATRQESATEAATQARDQSERRCSEESAED